MYKYIEFYERVSKEDRKTKQWYVRSRSNGVVLGEVTWYNAWRRYAFSPTPGVKLIFDAGCMKDIVSFIDKQMDLRNDRREVLTETRQEVI